MLTVKQQMEARVTVSCLKCGNKFEAKLYAVNNGRGRYCSTECKDAAEQETVTNGQPTN